MKKIREVARTIMACGLTAAVLIIAVLLLGQLIAKSHPTYEKHCEGFDMVYVWSDGSHDVEAGDSNCFQTGMDDGQ